MAGKQPAEVLGYSKLEIARKVPNTPEVREFKERLRLIGNTTMHAAGSTFLADDFIAENGEVRVRHSEHTITDFEIYKSLKLALSERIAPQASNYFGRFNWVSNKLSKSYTTEPEHEPLAAILERASRPFDGIEGQGNLQRVQFSAVTWLNAPDCKHAQFGLVAAADDESVMLWERQANATLQAIGNVSQRTAFPAERTAPVIALGHVPHHTDIVERASFVHQIQEQLLPITLPVGDVQIETHNKVTI